VSIRGTPANIHNEKIPRQLEGQAQRRSTGIRSSTIAARPTASNKEYDRANGLALDHPRLSIMERVSSELAGLERKSAPPPHIVGMEARAFNATDMLPPNPIVTGNMIGSMHPSNPLFSSFILKIEERYKPVQYSRRNISS
jgi:hypothetical protein